MNGMEWNGSSWATALSMKRPGMRPGSDDPTASGSNQRERSVPAGTAGSYVAAHCQCGIKPWCDKITAIMQVIAHVMLTGPIKRWPSCVPNATRSEPLEVVGLEQTPHCTHSTHSPVSALIDTTLFGTEVTGPILSRRQVTIDSCSNRLHSWLAVSRYYNDMAAHWHQPQNMKHPDAGYLAS